MRPPIRVLLADDHPTVRAGIRAALMAEGDIEVAGEASTRDEARRGCLALRPDVLVLDLNMPGPPLLEVVADLRARLPALQIVVLTAHDGAAQARELLGLGVGGYLFKDEPLEAVAQAIRAVTTGGTHFSRAIMAKVVPGRNADADGERAEMALTARERQLLRLLTQGWDTVRMARTVGISEQTARTYLSRLYGKLGVHSRAEATAWAHRHQQDNS